MRMPLGKYRGCPLDQIPTAYLTWLAQQAWPDPFLHRVVAAELDERARAVVIAQRTGAVMLRIQPCFMCLAKQLVETGYKALSKRLHPDHGGRTEDQQALNALADSFRSQFTELESR